MADQKEDCTVVTYWKTSEGNAPYEEIIGTLSLSPYTRVLLEKNEEEVLEMVADIYHSSSCADEAIVKALVKGVQIGMMDSVLSDKIMTMDLEIQRIIELNKTIEQET